MSAFNRLIMLIISLLLIAVPVVLLLVCFGVLSAGLIDNYTSYQSGLTAAGGLSASDFNTRLRTIIGIIGALVALIALLLVLRELTFGRRIARTAIVDDSPGKEIKITTRAVRALAEAAAMEVGTVSPSVSLRSAGRPYRVLCDIQTPSSSNRAQLATRARENIRRALEEQNVPVKAVEVTVRGTAA